MSLLTADNLVHTYGDLEVLKGVSLTIADGDRVGVVGPNGQGKTTLLRILCGELRPTDGRVSGRADLRVGYLPQEPPALEGTTVHEAALAVFDDVRRDEARLHELAEAVSARPDDADLLDRYGRLLADLETRGAYDYRRRVEAVLEGLAFPKPMWDRPLAKLSGGQRTRLYMARLLLQQPDLLVLDEPTNHLDLDAVEWLERWLGDFAGTLLVVSHDRYFLDRVTRRTWEVAFGGVEVYRGSYSAYVVERAERQKRREKVWRAQQAHVRETEAFIRRNIAAQKVAEARGRRTRLERFLREEAVERPQEHDTIRLRIDAGARTGDMTLAAEDLAVGYEASAVLLEAERLEVGRGQRVAIVGANGTGKTALLRTLLRDLPPVAGHVRHGANVRVGYLSQTQTDLPREQTALEAVLDAEPLARPEKARAVLGSLLLTGDDALRPVGTLSGGQQRRVGLARLIIREPNLLLLDEPTNHLDIPSTEIIQAALADFEGTVLFVTHDRYLVQGVASHIWALDAGTVRVILGGWGDYLAWRAEQRAGTTEAETADARAAQAEKADRKADYRRAKREANRRQRLQRRHAALEDAIHEAEAEVAAGMDAISAAGEAADVEAVTRLTEAYEAAQARLAALLAEWEEVGEALEGDEA